VSVSKCNSKQEAQQTNHTLIHITLEMFLPIVLLKLS